MVPSKHHDEITALKVCIAFWERVSVLRTLVLMSVEYCANQIICPSIPLRLYYGIQIHQFKPVANFEIMYLAMILEGKLLLLL